MVRYTSPDTAPERFASQRSPWITPLFLVIFAGLSVLLIETQGWLLEHYADLLNTLTRISERLSEVGSLGVRPALVAFTLSFPLFTNGRILHRVKVLVLFVTAGLLTMLVVDTVILRFGGMPFSFAGGVLSTFLGLVVIIAVFLRNVELPEGIKTPTLLASPRRYVFIAVGSLVAAIGLAVAVFIYAFSAVNALRNVSLLGGLGPGVPLVGSIFFPTILVLVTTLTRRRLRSNAMAKAAIYTPSVGIVVAAYNEAEGIADCIRSLDEASSLYRGTCYLYLIDNNSEDNTVEVAKTALEHCQNLKGEVLICEKRGKATALNFGVRQAKEDIVIRMDADTTCSKESIASVVPYFADPQMGAVGGLPLPKLPRSIFGRMRSIEVLHRIGFARLAQQASDAVVCLPGRFAAFRRRALTQAGEFAEGMNGEDTDMSIRIGRLGYRVIIDPAIQVFSEDPANLADLPHLREQRIRWGRAGIHSAVRNLSAFKMRQGTRGVWYIPMSLVSIFRRVLTLLLLIYGGLVLALDPTLLTLRHGATLGALVVGPLFLLPLGVLLAYRKFHLLPFLPGYLVFLLMRTYFTLEALFTLRAKRPGGVQSTDK